MAELDQNLQETSEFDKRIKDLSGKTKLAEEAREAAEKAKTEAEAKAADAERRAAFADSFTDILAKNPAAKDFKADIQAKVMSGYTPEDAAYAVLGKAGKIGLPQDTVSTPAGGSAPTNPTNGPKAINDMSTEEKRAELEKLLS